MNDLNHANQPSASGYSLDKTHIAQRKRFLELDDEDAGRLRAVHEQLKASRHHFADAFYDHLAGFEPLRAWLDDEEKLKRLKSAQANYFDALTAGSYDDDYVRERLRVGVVHQRIGLEPAWYLGAYRKYLAEIQKMLWELLGHDPEAFLKTSDAILKVVNFDIGLALDTYFEADTQEILEHKEYAEQIIHAMPSGLMVLDDGLSILSMNPAMQSMMQLGDDFTIIGAPLSAVINSKRLQDLAAEVLATGEKQTGIRLLGHKTRKGQTLEFSLTRIHRHQAWQLLLMAEDISARLSAEARLAQSEELYRLTFQNAAIGLAQVAPNGRLSQVNPKLCEILGYSQKELVGMNIQRLSHPEDQTTDLLQTTRLYAGEISHFSSERRCLHKSGQIIWIKLTVSRMLDANGRFQFIVAFEDISDRKRMEADLLHLAGHDALTGLPNRLLMHDRVAQAIALAKRNAGEVAVFYIDIDRFKNINDSFGHAYGDQVLCEMAQRINAALPQDCTLARLGGDEFVVLLSGARIEEAAQHLADRILETLSRPLRLQDTELFSSGSIGVAIYPKDGTDIEQLLKNADAAMYRAKSLGRNTFQFYASEMNARSLHRLRLGNELRRAIERNELLLHYQPKIDIASFRIVGMEALLRWRRSDGSMVGPNEFIPIAEETGLIVPLGAWVVQQACRQLTQWRRDGFSDLRLAVNLSPRQLKEPDFPQFIIQTLKSTGCPPSALDLEITEGMLIENPGASRHILQQLVDLGVRLSLDDFGTGHSSLTYLKRFPITTLKIDKSFIEDLMLDVSNEDSAIVKAVIELAHHLNVEVVAEGVETINQLEFLREHRCDQVQGFLFSKPLGPIEAGRILRLQGGAIEATSLAMRQAATH